MSNEIYDDLDELPAPPRVDIPKADRVLLELAARAIGAMRFEEVDGEGYANLHFADGLVLNAWNSLVHSDDALDLAVRLNLSIDIRADAICVIAGDSNHAVIEKFLGAERLPATRRAITRAAAEIGT